MASVLSVPDNQSEDKHVESSLVPRLDEGSNPSSSTMDKKDEKALEEKSKIQKDAEGTLPGRQLGLYSKVDKKEVRNMVSEINPDKNSLGSRG